HMDWLEDDLAIKSVADRVAMFRKHEGEDGLRDGYSVETERITRLVDTDGDGVADEATAFADDFADPAAGIGAPRPSPQRRGDRALVHLYSGSLASPRRGRGRCRGGPHQAQHGLRTPRGAARP
ncbi:MAG: hypothetical protein ACPGPE_11475, partial [Planctomycetota bacterium]